MTNTTYNGWANYHTWNVSLYIQNDEGLYHLAQEFDNYTDLADSLTDCETYITPDGVSYTDPALDVDELNEMLAEL